MTSEAILLGFGYDITGKTPDQKLESIKLAFDKWKRRNDATVLVLLSLKSPLLEKAQVQYPHITFGTHKQVKLNEVFIREKTDEDTYPYHSGSAD